MSGTDTENQDDNAGPDASAGIDTIAREGLFDNVFETQISLAITLDSDSLTTTDVRGVLNLVEGIIDCVDARMRAGRPFAQIESSEGPAPVFLVVERWLVPEISFETGCLNIWVTLKTKYEKLTDEGKTRVATLLAATIVAVGGVAAAGISRGGETEIPPIEVKVDNEIVIKTSPGSPGSKVPEDVEQAISEIKNSCAVTPAINAWHRAIEDYNKYGNKVPVSIEVECKGQHYVLTWG
jgi:hypothetical protein